MREVLVRLREDAALTRQQLAYALEVAERTVGRWESGERTPLMSQRGPLAAELRCSLATLNAALRDEHPKRHEVPNHLRLFASLEQGAAELRCHEGVVVPGLLQTAEYARVVESVGPKPSSEDEIAQRVRRRLDRQRVLRKPDGLRLFALIDASVFLRMTGDPDVMAAQLDHIQTMNRRPNIQVRTLPLDQRAHCVAFGSFTLLSAERGSPPWLFCCEDLSGFRYVETPSVVESHHETWLHLWEGADDVEKVEL